jgi:hypothetical protein
MFLSYFLGFVALGVLYIISVVVTKGNWNPFALALGVDNNISVSLLQFLIFTYLTIFAYVVVFVARYQSQHLTTPPDIPVNLLILMGLSVATATASKGIVVSYVDQNKLPDVGANDKSGTIQDKNGNIALTKIQMLIWTCITVAIYVATLVKFVGDGKYNQVALPDVDGALLVLMGAAQGAYIGGKLVSTATNTPIIERIIPSPVKLNAPPSPIKMTNAPPSPIKMTIRGRLFGDSQGNNAVLYRDAGTWAQREVPVIVQAQWTDNKIEFDIPSEMQKAGTYTMWVTVDGQMSNGCDIVVT